MENFLQDLQYRNGPLFIFGLLNLSTAMVLLITSCFSNIKVTGVNAWFKPIKFALSIGVFSWTMGWYAYELNALGPVSLYTWVVIVLLGFEIIYITLQAGRGQLSHYNSSSPIYAFLFMVMGFAAALVTFWTAYIGILFLTADLRHLPGYYVLGIRTGIFLFVVFSLEGALMGARLAHTVSGPDGGPGLLLVNWSTRYGDLRIAHFIGMHALQVLPLLSWYVFKNTTATAIAGVLYALLAGFTLVQALKGKPLMGR